MASTSGDDSGLIQSSRSVSSFRMVSAPNKGELLAFFVRRDTKCTECAQELYSGSMTTLDRQRGALCLVCADLDHLEFLPSGDAAVKARVKVFQTPSITIRESGKPSR